MHGETIKVMESSGHVHAKAPLILIKTIPVQSGYGNEETSLPEVKHWSFSSQTFILLSELNYHCSVLERFVHNSQLTSPSERHPIITLYTYAFSHKHSYTYS